MDRFKEFILGLGTLFTAFLVLIGSVAGIVQMVFSLIIYLFRKQLRSALRSVSKKDFALVVIFGTFFGLLEEILWYVSDHGVQQSMFSSLSNDLASMLPLYFIFYLVIYVLTKHKQITQKRAFLYGGIFGYVFYFIAESGIFGFQFGGISGAPLILILVWEINNFFLNGLLVWFPLYLSDLFIDKE